MLRVSRENIGYIFLLPALIGTSLLIIFPLAYSVSMSFHTWRGGPSRFIGFANYISIFTDDPLFRQSLRVSLVYVLVAVASEFALGLVIALLINNITKRLVWFFRVLMIVPWVIPPVLGAMSFRMIYHPTFGLFNYGLNFIGIEVKDINLMGNPSTALLSIIIADIWRWTPFMFLMLTAGLQSVPIEPLEAAHIDGASPFQVFRYITIPMLKGVIITALLFRSIDALQAFDIIFAITKGGPGTVTQTLNIYAFTRAFGWAHLGYGAALATIIMSIILVMVVVVERFGRIMEI